MIYTEAANRQENRSFTILKQFGASLVSSRNLSEVFNLAGKAFHALVPDAMLIMSKPVNGDVISMQMAWQFGCDRYLDAVKAILRVDPFQMTFSHSRATPEELLFFRDGKLHHLENGLRDFSLRVIPKPVCFALEKLLGIVEIHAMGLSWNDTLYGSLGILLPKGVTLENTPAIETIASLASVGIQRVMAEEAITQSEAQYRALVEQSHDGITITRGNRIVFANQSFLRMLGYDSPDDLATVPIMDIVAPESRETVLAKRKQIRTGPQEFDAKLILKNGRVRDFNVATSEIVFNGRKYLQSSLIDITERKNAEANRITMQRLEALGVLAAGIAHDFNNLHMGIFGFIECAKVKIDNVAAAADLDKALASMHRARELTSRLITFANGGAPILRCAPIFPFAEEVIRSAVDGSVVRCSIEVSGGLRRCLYDRDQLRQVLQGMVCNAIEAMPEGGDLLVSAANTTLSETSRMNLPAGDYLRLAIADHGIGIPEKSLPHIFSPFFSTKPIGGGLNLSIAYSVLKRHGGGIEVESTPGRGTTFNLYLQAEKE